MEAMQKTLILGVGNTLLADEGLGIHLLEHLRAQHPELPGVTYLDGGTLSFTLAPEIEDCQNLIVLDAAQLQTTPGTIRLLEGAEMDHFIGHGQRSVHEVGLVDLMSIARLQDRLPGNRALLGIQPLTLGWGDSPSDVVADAIPEASDTVIRLLYKWQVINNTLF
jgi:hydrogenase maturation protease